jgi:hypothetical protein
VFATIFRGGVPRETPRISALDPYLLNLYRLDQGGVQTLIEAWHESD